MKERVFLALAFFLFVAAAKNPIQGNLALAEGKLIFCERDKSLTILDASTGKVLLHDPKAQCDGEFVTFLHGTDAVLLNYGRVQVFDVAKNIAAGHFAPAFELSPCRGYATEVAWNHVICAYSTNTIIENRSIPDGKILWQLDVHDDVNGLRTSLDRIAVTLGAYNLTRQIVLIDAKDGKELLRWPIPQDGKHPLNLREFILNHVTLQGESPACEKGTNTVKLDLTGVPPKAVADDCSHPWIAEPPACPFTCAWFANGTAQIGSSVFRVREDGTKRVLESPSAKWTYVLSP